MHIYKSPHSVCMYVCYCVCMCTYVWGGRKGPYAYIFTCVLLQTFHELSDLGSNAVESGLLVQTVLYKENRQLMSNLSPFLYRKLFHSTSPYLFTYLSLHTYMTTRRSFGIYWLLRLPCLVQFPLLLFLKKSSVKFIVPSLSVC